MSSSRRIGTLLFRHIRKELTAAEEKELKAWRNLAPENERLYQDKSDPEKIRESMAALYKNKDLVFQQIRDRIPDMADAELSNSEFPKKIKVMKKRLFYLPRAAAIFIIVTGAAMFAILFGTGVFKPKTAGQFDVVYISPEGVEMAMDDFHRGFLDGQAGITFEENEKGERDYIASNKPNKPHDKNFGIRSARDGHFRLKLPEGTWVWINSKTTINYPANFSQDSIRVNIKGEAYFNVQADLTKQFIVSARSSVIGHPSSTDYAVHLKANGAHFNLRAYPDSTIQITLLQGNLTLNLDSVGKSISELQLVPGQQAQLIDGKLVFFSVDVNKVAAWTKW